MNKDYLNSVILIVAIGVSFILMYFDFGIKALNISIEFQFLIPVLIALLFNIIYRLKIKKIRIFITLISLFIFLMLWANLVRLNIIDVSNIYIALLSLFLFIVYNLLIVVSFWQNNPFYIEFYKINPKDAMFFKIVYKLVSIIYLFSAITYVIMTVDILDSIIKSV